MKPGRERLVTLLSVAGLIPFAGLALLGASGDAFFSQAFLIYSVGISAFLSGAWWGFALSKTPQPASPVIPLVLSNCLVLVSVAALIWAEPAIALLTQAGVLSLLAVGERRIKPMQAAPRYYQRMRWHVSAVAVLLHLGLWAFL